MRTSLMARKCSNCFGGRRSSAISSLITRLQQLFAALAQGEERHMHRVRLHFRDVPRASKSSQSLVHSIDGGVPKETPVDLAGRQPAGGLEQTKQIHTAFRYSHGSGSFTVNPHSK